MEKAGVFGVRAPYPGKPCEGGKGVQQRAELPLEVIHPAALDLLVESLGVRKGPSRDAW